VPTRGAPALAGAWFGVTAAVVLVALVIRVALAVDGSGGTVEGRLFDDLCFFTIQSNVLIGVVSGLLAIRPDRPSTAFRVLHITGVVSIFVTSAIYYAIVSDGGESDWALGADILLHAIVPLLAVLGWLVFGPHAPDLGGKVLLTLAFPTAWLVLTLVRGAITDSYPYPFVDVTELGYPPVALNVVLLGAGFVALALLVAAIDRRRVGSPASRSTPGRSCT
jgi:hypothetical protein